MSENAFNRIIGSNERINIGFIGCGARKSIETWQKVKIADLVTFTSSCKVKQ